MGAFFAGLQGLIITVKRNAWSSVFTTLMLFLLIVTWSARANISTFIERNPTAAQEKIRFDRSVVADGQINEALANLRKKMNADRVLIRQFHNSKTDLTGLPFASISTTYYSAAPGVAVSNDFQSSFPLSTINEQLMLMFKYGQEPTCIRIAYDDVEEEIFRDYLKQNGISLTYACPLIDLRGQPVGVITIHYLIAEKKHPDDQVIMDTLNDTGIRVVGYLAGILDEENRSWYVKLLDW